jgi:hypothetical protein
MTLSLATRWSLVLCLPVLTILMIVAHLAKAAPEQRAGVAHRRFEVK